MCGIVGIYHYGASPRVDELTLTRMRDTMIHRGPDGAGNWIAPDGRIGLGHRRLSIIDLSAAATQPMANEDETVWVTFNGEIYNHVGLRRELVQAGHRFATDHADTEVLVHGHEQWGIDGLLSRLEGDYGFALWDSRTEALYLVRDRVGVKPLYFAIQDGKLLFGSEIKAIVAHPDVTADVEPAAMYHYLSFLTTPAPLTMFKGVFKLPAGYYLEVNKNGRFRAKRYWDALPGQGIPRTDIASLGAAARESYYVDGIRMRLRRAVEKRMMSDVPFGVFLSGGIDSSTNVALMSQFANRPLNTFTVGFKDHTHLNELGEAELVAKRFATNHHQVLIDADDMRGYLSDLIYHQDEPIADWVCIPLAFVSKLARDNGVTVVQVGEGSDEQFCGYRSYMGYLNVYRRLWSPFRKLVPAPLQRAASAVALWGASKRPSLDVYADIVDRASHDRELFWSGAMAYWESSKARLVVPGTVHGSAMPPELLESGLLPLPYLHDDTFEVIHSFTDHIDRMQPGQDVLARMIYNEFKLRLPELLLMRVDKIAMGVSLEARVPFLDHKLVEFTMDIPMKDKVRGATAKYLLKKAVEGLIPDPIIHRKKMGFGAPMSEWLRGEFGTEMQGSLMSSRLLDRGFFRRDYIMRLFEEHRTQRRDNSLYLWTLFNLTAWYDYWVDGRSSTPSRTRVRETMAS
jgi:asparagine synthase (glutamine-hydrolysing)